MNNPNKYAQNNFNLAAFKQIIRIEDDVVKVDAAGLHYRELNSLLKTLNNNGTRRIDIHNVFGQRYIGTNLDGSMEVNVHGTPGNDLGAFMRGLTINIYGNAQDGCGNTMDDGKIVIHGYAGDIIGNSMRGGKIFVRDNAGYRVGIHMKEYEEKKPVIVIGGVAQDFLGEYMAGGILVLLGLPLGNNMIHDARFVGTGMHGGKMYIRGKVDNPSRDIKVVDLEDDDRKFLHSLVCEFCDYFKLNLDAIMAQKFSKIIPISKRPYGAFYTG